MIFRKEFGIENKLAQLFFRAVRNPFGLQVSPASSGLKKLKDQNSKQQKVPKIWNDEDSELFLVQKIKGSPVESSEKNSAVENSGKSVKNSTSNLNRLMTEIGKMRGNEEKRTKRRQESAAAKEIENSPNSISMEIDLICSSSDETEKNSKNIQSENSKKAKKSSPAKKKKRIHSKSASQSQNSLSSSSDEDVPLIRLSEKAPAPKKVFLFTFILFYLQNLSFIQKFWDQIPSRFRLNLD